MTEPVQRSEIRDTGVRGILIYCADYHCSHSLAISGDRRPDDVRLSDIQDRFARAPCGKWRRRSADFNWNTKPVGMLVYH
jgi:hypothetical protein